MDFLAEERPNLYIIVKLLLCLLCSHICDMWYQFSFAIEIYYSSPELFTLMFLDGRKKSCLCSYSFIEEGVSKGGTVGWGTERIF